MKIAILLPMREPYSLGKVGAVALFVAQSNRLSRYRKDITVYGAPVATPFDDNFKAIKKPRWSLRTRSAAYVQHFVRALQADPPDLIELHNRPIYVSQVRRAFPKASVVLHLHNAPNTQKGAGTPKVRRNLVTQCDRVLCCSNFVRDMARKGLPKDLQARIQTHYYGFERSSNVSLEAREKRIIFAGRVAPNKGTKELLEAAIPLLHQYPDWSIDFFGAERKTNKRMDAYMDQINALLENAPKDRIIFHGYTPYGSLMAALQRSAIVAVPSMWEEPFGRIAAEALTSGCALIHSGRGGLGEIAPDASLNIDPEDTQALRSGLELLMTDERARLDLQRRGLERAKIFDEHDRQDWHDNHRAGLRPD